MSLQAEYKKLDSSSQEDYPLLQAMRLVSLMSPSWCVLFTRIMYLVVGTTSLALDQQLLHNTSS